MKEYTFHVTLLATLRISSNTALDAESDLRQFLSNARIYPDCPNKKVCVESIEIEGDVDMLDINT